jgi:transcriptional regulator with XRE-family HTH domain
MKTKVGYYIREYRKANDVSQMDLAKEIGVRQSVISDYERGLLNPSLPILRKLSQITGVALETLTSPTEATPCQN